MTEKCLSDTNNKDIVLQQTTDYTSEDFSALLQKITSLGLWCHEEVRQPLTGGSTYIIELYGEDGLTLSLYNYGLSSGTFSGDIESFQHIVESSLPSFKGTSKN